MQQPSACYFRYRYTEEEFMRILMHGGHPLLPYLRLLPYVGPIAFVIVTLVYFANIYPAKEVIPYFISAIAFGFAGLIAKWGLPRAFAKGLHLSPVNQRIMVILLLKENIHTYILGSKNVVPWKTIRSATLWKNGATLYANAGIFWLPYDKLYTTTHTEAAAFHQALPPEAEDSIATELNPALVQRVEELICSNIAKVRHVKNYAGKF